MKLFALLLFLFAGQAFAKNPVVVMETNMGVIELEIFQDKAPLSAKNFLDYVNSKFYNGTIFHRVISTFMIQGGGFTEKMEQKPTKAPIKNEASNGLKNEIGTVAMARTQDLNSATSQFFINVAQNTSLDGSSGYAVFGKVVNGMHVVERIKGVRTGSKGGHNDVPMDTVLIKSMKVK